MRPPDSTPQLVLRRYLALYARCYRERRIDDPNLIDPLVAGGALSRLLYVGRLSVPCYVADARPAVLFDPSTSRPLFTDPQAVLMEALFVRVAPSAPPAGRSG